jgi:hypothetical protein
VDSYTITFADHSDAALGALADAAERVGFPDLSNALRSAALARSETRPVPEHIVLGSDE